MIEDMILSKPERNDTIRHLGITPVSKYAHDPYAKAARSAIMKYAGQIENENPGMARGLRHWVLREREKEDVLRRKEGLKRARAFATGMTAGNPDRHQEQVEMIEKLKAKFREKAQKRVEKRKAEEAQRMHEEMRQSEKKAEALKMENPELNKPKPIDQVFCKVAKSLEAARAKKEALLQEKTSPAKDQEIPLSELQALVYKNAVDHGLWEDIRSKPEAISRLHTEVSEALEAHHYGNREGFAEELADVVIMVLSMGGHYGIDVSKEIIKKHVKNLRRPYRHGNKNC